MSLVGQSVLTEALLGHGPGVLFADLAKLLRQR